MKNRLLALSITALVAIGSMVTAFGLGGAVSAAEERECGTNSIITCGTMTSAELKQKYAENKGDLQAIFSHYNISAADIASSDQVKTGFVNPDGTVTVDGKVVATNAETAGRKADLGGSAVKINDTTTVYQGGDRLESPLSAFVFMKDGEFKSAVIKVCGNPVVAKPVEKPKPAATCKEIQREKISRTESRYTAVATVTNGATIKSYDFIFTNERGETITKTTVTTTATTAKTGVVKLETGTYTLKVVVHTSLGDISSDACSLKIIIEAVPDKDIEVCRLEDKKWMTVKETEYNANKSKYSTNKADCDTKKVCVIAEKVWKDVTLSEIAKNPSKYSDKAADCETPKPVVTMKSVCRLSDKQWIEITESAFNSAPAGTYSTVREDCQVKGEVKTLASTGPVEAALSLAGVSSLAGAGYYYSASRRAIKNKLLETINKK